MGKKSESGQAMTEYATVIVLFLGVVAALDIFLEYVIDYGLYCISIFSMDL